MYKQTDFNRRKVIGGLSGAVIAGIAGCLESASESIENDQSEAETSTDSVSEQADDPAESHSTVRLELLGRYSASDNTDMNLLDTGAAEIVAYDGGSERAFVANEAEEAVDVLNLSDPANPTLVEQLVLEEYLNWDDADAVSSVEAKGGLVAATVPSETLTDEGRAVIIDPEALEVIDWDVAGSLPDNGAFTPDCSKFLVANEGAADYVEGVIPKGQVTIFSLSDSGQITDTERVTFEQFDGREDELREQGVRIYGPSVEDAQDPNIPDDEVEPGLSASEDFEVEYVTVAPDGETAYAALQVNNAIAEIDIDDAEVTGLYPLGLKDHMLPGNELDASDDDGRVNIRNWPVKGMYMPDGTDTYTVGGETFIVTSNEGSDRDEEGWSERAEVGDLDLNEDAFDFDHIAGIDSVEELQEDKNLGELRVSTATGDIDDDGKHEEIHVEGARSFAIWNSDGNMVFESGSDMERITAQRHGYNFNNDNDEHDPDGRSDARGPEPEGIDVAYINDRAYAFIALERMGGVMVYDITAPENADFVQYINERDFSIDIEGEIEDGPLPADAAGDLGTEDVEFVPEADSPVDTPLVLTANEGSGTTPVFEVNIIAEE